MATYWCLNEITAIYFNRWYYQTAFFWWKFYCFDSNITFALKGPFNNVSLSVHVIVWCRTSHYTWWRHQMELFQRHWPFMRGIHRSPVDSPHKGPARGNSMFVSDYVRFVGCFSQPNLESEIKGDCTSTWDSQVAGVSQASGNNTAAAYKLLCR